MRHLATALALLAVASCGAAQEETVKQTALKEGMKAPDFTTPSTAGEISLAALRGKVVVLYFYPKDATPGCTREACAFRDLKSQMESTGAVVLGVSKDSLASHEKFARNQSLNFPLLSDPEGRIISLFGAWKEKSMFGKTAMGIERSTFLIDREGVVRRIWRSVKVDGHDREVLEAVKALE